MLLKRIEPLKENYQKLEVSELSTKEIDQAINECLQKIDQNMAIFGEKFPAPATKNQNYQVIDNTEWTTAFWTGILWIAYDITKENKYKDLAEKHIESFSRRLSQNIEINHHDLGFLYTLSCVSCYKITGNSQ
jgi:unsaturated chondroitin disaccharide hydrolase